MNSTEQDIFSVEMRADGVAVIRMDVPGEPVNTIRADFTPAFEQVFAQLEQDGGVRAVVFTSGKKSGFLAGADIKMLQKASTAAAAADLSRTGQAGLNRLAKFRVPVVAAIDGACLGGGLELALACHGRVASDNPKTKLGLPEVQLGLLPGAGGTQRLPRLIGVQAALDLLLTGKQVDGRKAKKLGLVDDVVPAAIVVEVAAQRALSLAEQERPHLTDRLRDFLSADKLQELSLERNPLGRQLVFGTAKKEVVGKTQGNYPAPEKILQVVRTGLADGLEKGLEAEAVAFGELVVSPQAAQLMNIYFATTALKKDSGTNADVTPRTVERVGMLGAGLMGSGIAYVTAFKGGVAVRLKDRDHAGVGRGLKAVRALLEKRVTRRRMTALERDQVLSKVSGGIDAAGFASADLVIEAVFEDLGLKRKMLEAVEAAGKPDVIFASNTSSIPITDIATASKHPETVIGMHYFSPVDKMPLLEIITTKQTSPETTATCVALGKAQGKTVIVVNDGVGFYTTRILAPYMNEASYVLSEGTPIEVLDRALVAFGFPVGPITLMDEVGIDVGEKVGKILNTAFGERLTPPPGTERLIQDERLGRKNKRGFYRYDTDAKKGPKPVDEAVYELLGVTPNRGPVDEEALAVRCTLQLVNEAARCFGEGILRSARDGDIGAIFGLGFPPFLGGPFRYADALGSKELLSRLERLHERFGVRFTPAPLIVQMAKEGLSFYGENAVAPGTTSV